MVTTVRTGMQTTIGGVIHFERESAKITSQAMPLIRQIAGQVRGHTNVFMVKGHTSKDEEYTLRETHRDLSYERAQAVIKKLVELGVAREAFRIQSCRDFEPIKEGVYKEVSRASNRRVEVIATEALISEYRGKRDTEH